jgi:Raf kinase inhibitor-like YbhB/YbcL family protein
MQLSSTAFSDDSAIPRRFTCDGKDLSPSLAWEATPPAVRGFVLLRDDPDAPAGTCHHWAVYDIDVDQTGMGEGASCYLSAAQYKQAINEFHRVGYGGPLPASRSWTAPLSFPPAGPFG